MNPFKAAHPVNVTKNAVGLAGTAVGVAGTVAREAVHAPAGLTRSAIHLAGAAAGVAGTVARETVQGLRGGQHPAAQETASGAGDGADGASAAAGATAFAGAGDSDVEGAPPGPVVVAAEPQAPEEPPVDVVGQALAAEAAAERGETNGAGMAHEPRGASRDDEHGDAGLQRPEVEEVAAEVEAALSGDVEPEEHLTQPLLDPADVKAVVSEQQTMSRAADPDKG